jgi:hypothetical protein
VIKNTWKYQEAGATNNICVSCAVFHGLKMELPLKNGRIYLEPTNDLAVYEASCGECGGKLGRITISWDGGSAPNP